MFMRGWTWIFGGYPSEAELIAMFDSEEPIDLESAFWIYIGVFAITFAFAAFFQFVRDEEAREKYRTLGGKDDEYQAI